MADKPPAEQRQDMTDEEIRAVFETLELSTAPKPVPLVAQSIPGPIVFFPVSGNSPHSTSVERE